MKKIAKTIYIYTIFSSLIITFCHYINTINKKENTIEISSIQTKKIAYLTFDDGPSNNTQKILEILDKYNIKATFFVTGPSYKQKNDLLTKIVKNGHELAIHSYEHNYNYIYTSKENYLKDFYACLNWIKSITGITPTIYRFPGGSSNTIAKKSLIKDIIVELANQGFTHADWNVDTLDSFIKNDYQKAITNALTSIKKNENNNHYYQTVLLHDDVKKQATLKALPSLIEKILSKGYHFEKLTKNSNIIKHVK